MRGAHCSLATRVFLLNLMFFVEKFQFRIRMLILHLPTPSASLGILSIVLSSPCYVSPLSTHESNVRTLM